MSHESSKAPLSAVEQRIGGNDDLLDTLHDRIVEMERSLGFVIMPEAPTPTEATAGTQEISPQSPLYGRLAFQSHRISYAIQRLRALQERLDV